MSLTDALGDRATHRLLKLPAVAQKYAIHRDVRIPLRDGVVLLADHYVPNGAVRGTILVRSPYGRAGLFGALFARPYALQGFRVLIVSCRATFGSGGSLNAFAGEIEDGADTVAWMRRQPWFTGTFATLGTSYLGLTQWALFCDPPPELACAVIVSGPHDTGRLLYGNGAMSLVSSVGWTSAMLGQGEHGPLMDIARALVLRDRPVRPVLDGLPLRGAAHEAWGDRAPWFDAWLEHPEPDDPWWEGARVTEGLARADVPVLLYSGWQDQILDQVLESYAALSARDVDVQLVVGPWSHAELSTKGAAQITTDTLAWIGEHLVGDGKRSHAGPVRIKVGGAGEWRELAAWPPPTTGRQFYLSPGGGLTDSAPAAGAQPMSFTYDPQDPTPSVGGLSNAIDAGRRDNTAREKRGDVLVFTTEPLTTPVDIAGTPEISFSVTSDNPHIDWFVRLCEVDAAGRSWNVSEGYARRATPQEHLQLELSTTAHRFGVGTRIRVQVSGGAHPVYDRNPGTGGRIATATTTRRSTRGVALAEGASSITLPLVS